MLALVLKLRFRIVAPIFTRTETLLTLLIVQLLESLQGTLFVIAHIRHLSELTVLKQDLSHEAASHLLEALHQLIVLLV